MANRMAGMANLSDKLPSRFHDRGGKLSPKTAKKTSVDADDILFDLLAEKDGKITMASFWAAVRETGILEKDARLKDCYKRFKLHKRKMGLSDELEEAFRVDKSTFKECTKNNISIITKVFMNDMVIPEWEDFIGMIQVIYSKCLRNDKGMPAMYIPQLARMNPKHWGVAICTIDGQRKAFGDSGVTFSMQSCCKPLNYALAVSEMGTEKVHEFMGLEPSGRSFNELTLDYSKKPHNPLINSGAIIVSALIKQQLSLADRFDYVFRQYKKIAGEEYVGFSNATYLSERETADRNFALAHYMRENKCFPENADLTKTLEFYFQCCSVEINVNSASVMAATLANGGICPITGEKILTSEAVRNTLSLMHSCGMYDYSGHFAFKVGLPAKSGVSGGILLVVPNVMGICAWSPPLDRMGNSTRGVQFCEELVSIFNFHHYDGIFHMAKKLDPRKRNTDQDASVIVNLLFGAANGDVTVIHRFFMLGMNMGTTDYDGRTALHLACAEGHLNVVKVLLEKCGVIHNPKDRWGFTPFDDALKFGHDDIVDYIEKYGERLAQGLIPEPQGKQFQMDFNT